MNKIFIILITSSFLFFSCNSNSPKETEQTSESQVTIEDITTLEGKLFGEEMASPDLVNAKKLIDLYITYVNQNPKDELSPEMLFKAADITMNLSSAPNTIALFNRIIMEYPDYENIPTIMFLKGFVYEDQLQDYEKAGKCYIEFLEKYPESDFADDAKVSLDNLGKSPEELIKEFESRN